MIVNCTLNTRGYSQYERVNVRLSISFYSQSIKTKQKKMEKIFFLILSIDA